MFYFDSRFIRSRSEFLHNFMTNSRLIPFFFSFYILLYLGIGGCHQSGGRGEGVFTRHFTTCTYEPKAKGEQAGVVGIQ